LRGIILKLKTGLKDSHEGHYDYFNFFNLVGLIK